MKETNMISDVSSLSNLDLVSTSKKKETSSKILDSEPVARLSLFATHKKSESRNMIFDDNDQNDNEIDSVINLEENQTEHVESDYSDLFRKVKRFSKRILRNNKFIVFMYVLTFYILFVDYIKIMLFDSRVDLGFDIVTILCIFCFVFELTLMIISNPAYAKTYFFYFDIIMTFGIIFNISMIATKIFYNSNSNYQNIINKIVKFIRLIRIIRILNLFKERPAEDLIRKSTITTKTKESKVTTHLRERIIRRLIMLIMIMWIVVPLLDYDVYSSRRMVTEPDKIYLMINTFAINPTQSNAQTIVTTIQNDMSFNSSQTLGRLYIQGFIDYRIANYEYIRVSELSSYSISGYLINGVPTDVEIALSYRYISIIQAGLDLGTTICLALILLVSVWELNGTMKTLILVPLERMIEKIKAVSLDPLGAIKKKMKKQVEEGEMNEALVIEESINKISELLILGFGQAGCRIISKSLFEVDKEIDDIFSGEKTYAIFGFCYIMQFNDLTQILQEEIIVFVNTIAEMVHVIVDEHHGAVNRNLGDAFLLTWNLKDNGYKYFHDSVYREELALGNVSPPMVQEGVLKEEDDFNRQLTELALLAFIRVVIEINSSKQISSYAKSESIQKEIPGYKVKMGLGLHIGWAIEGAIGSTFKIDASYLSPNVNMAARLEAATKQFGVEILYSGPFFNLIQNHHIRDISRHLDTVNVKGSKEPMKLYTVDLNLKCLKEKQKTTTAVSKTISAFRKDISQADQKRINYKKTKGFTLEGEKLDNTLLASNLIKFNSMEESTITSQKLADPIMSAVLEINSESNKMFRNVFRFAVNAYLKGDWHAAQNFFKRSLEMRPNDKPSKVLLHYIMEFGLKCPEEWKGCRELTEK